MINSDSIIELTARLVRQPSRAGIDPHEPIADIARHWLAENGIESEGLFRDGRLVGLVAEVRGDRRGPCYVLNATLDTAHFGNEEAWSHSPTSAHIENGWMYGRGTSDSKCGVAVFCHLLAQFNAFKAELAGKLVLLLDLDEHTGGFAGVKAWLDGLNRQWPAGVFIGYPGNDRIVVGGRGFLRGVLSVYGKASHSGSSSQRGVNAVVRAASLIDVLAGTSLPAAEVTSSFPIPARLTVTTVNGGSSFSMIPDKCDIGIDVRLTPHFGEELARDFVSDIVHKHDATQSEVTPTNVDWQPGWPAFLTSSQHPMVDALQSAAQSELSRDVPLAVVGPSNIGNYLHTFGIPAVSGFGVTYRDLHGTNECIDLSSIEPVYRVYLTALRTLLSGS